MQFYLHFTEGCQSSHTPQREKMVVVGLLTTCGESARAHLNGNRKAFDFCWYFCLNDSKATDNSGEDKRLSQGL